jgi:hypothetical protein
MPDISVSCTTSFLQFVCLCEMVNGFDMIVNKKIQKIFPAVQFFVSVCTIPAGLGLQHRGAAIQRPIHPSPGIIVSFLPFLDSPGNFF